VAFLATTILFAIALLAMRTVRIGPLFTTTRDDVAPPTIIHFEPPPPKVIPKPRVEPAPARAKSAAPVGPIVAPTTVPTVIAPPVAVPLPATVPPVRDSSNATSRGAPTRRITDLLPTREIPTFPKSAPRTSAGAPAGVTEHMKELTVAERDSIATVKMARLAAALNAPFTDAERKTAAAHAEPGAPLPGSRAAGDAPLMNGGSSVRIPIASISAPIFTRKPLPVESTEDRLRRKRLEDRAALVRDSLRADSIAKARIRP
jgi:hypothetical protein